MSSAVLERSATISLQGGMEYSLGVHFASNRLKKLSWTALDSTQIPAPLQWRTLPPFLMFSEMSSLSLSYAKQMIITYQKNIRLTVTDIIRVFNVSGIKRPIHDKMRIEQMFANSNLVFSAWDGEKLIGICRCLTDFNYACYLSDLAVDQQYQSQGVGKELIQKVREDIGKNVSLILLSAPTAMHYYPKVGFAPIDNGFVIKREQ